MTQIIEACMRHTTRVNILRFLLQDGIYTPGQKFIDFFFNELSHQDNGEYQQFVNSGMETYHFSTNLLNIARVGALVKVLCP